MLSDLELLHKVIGTNHELIREVHVVPLLGDLEKCKGCPYPGIGFICWDTDGSCMRTEVEKLSRRGR